MSDTKLRPEDLRAKAEALIESVNNDTDGREEIVAWIEAVTGALAPAPEKVAKVETMADRIAADLKAGTFRGEQPAPPEPAAPVNGSTPVGEYDPDMKPAAREMPEAVRVGTFQLEELLKYADFAEVALRTGFHPPEFLFEPADRSLRQAIDAIKRQRDGWRNLAQPVAVGMTEELEHVLSIAERDLRYKEECFDNSARTVHDERIERLRAAIAAVREQCGRK